MIITGEYPKDFIDSIEATWAGSRSLYIGFYSIKDRKNKLLSCLAFNLQQEGEVEVLSGDLDLLCNELNNKTSSLLDNYPQTINHTYILIDGGPLDNQYFIPSQYLLISKEACSILHIPKSNEELIFEDIDWCISFNYINRNYHVNIVQYSTKGTWSIKLEEGDYILFKHYSEIISPTVFSGTLEDCLCIKEIHAKAFFEGKKSLANDLISRLHVFEN